MNTVSFSAQGYTHPNGAANKLLPQHRTLQLKTLHQSDRVHFGNTPEAPPVAEVSKPETETPKAATPTTPKPSKAVWIALTLGGAVVTALALGFGISVLGLPIALGIGALGLGALIWGGVKWAEKAKAPAPAATENQEETAVKVDSQKDENYKPDWAKLKLSLNEGDKVGGLEVTKTFKTDLLNSVSDVLPEDNLKKARVSLLGILAATIAKKDEAFQTDFVAFLNHYVKEEGQEPYTKASLTVTGTGTTEEPASAAPLLRLLHKNPAVFKEWINNSLTVAEKPYHPDFKAMKLTVSLPNFLFKKEPKNKIIEAFRNYNDILNAYNNGLQVKKSFSNDKTYTNWELISLAKNKMDKAPFFAHQFYLLTLFGRAVMAMDEKPKAALFDFINHQLQTAYSPDNFKLPDTSEWKWTPFKPPYSQEIQDKILAVKNDLLKLIEILNDTYKKAPNEFNINWAANWEMKVDPDVNPVF